MNQKELNQLPEKMQRGELTEKQAVNKICIFVILNYPLYGLHKYDEDFRQDIMLNLLERGSHLLHLYNSNYADFSTYLYCYICTLINSRLKKNTRDSIQENLNFEEGINTLDELSYRYHRIDFTNFEVPKAPFAPKQLSPEELHKAFGYLNKKQHDKKILILALKSSYYLTDAQISRICRAYHINPDYFYSMIQHCKNTLENKSIKRDRIQERRNFAYYHHKRYSRYIQKIDEDYVSDNKKIIRNNYANLEKKHFRNWNSLNKAFEKGMLYLRPTNKTVAELMGICERQVIYYLKSARKELQERNLQGSKTSEA